MVLSVAPESRTPTLLLEGKDLTRLPQDLSEVECLVVLDPAATHVSVSLDPKRPTLVIHYAGKQ